MHHILATLTRSCEIKKTVKLRDI